MKNIKEKIKNIYNTKIKKHMNFIMPIVVLSCFYLFYKVAFDLNFKFYFKSIVFGIFLTTLIYLFIVGITKKLHISSLIISIIFMIFMTGSCIKIYYTNDPILYSDIKYLNDIFEITSIVDNSLLFTSVTVALPAILYIILNIFLIRISFKYKYTVKKLWLRICFIVIPVLIFSVLLFPSSEFKHFILKNVYNLEGKGDFGTQTSNINHYARFGIVSGMYAHYLENMLDVPYNYNDEKLNKLLKNSNENKDKKFGQPNIIVFFAESFWDINKVSNEVNFDKKITFNLNKLKNEGIYFEMISPSYGGTSANVEFEFLTGANLAYFGNGYVPYMQLYTNKNYYNAPSIIHELKNNDYYTKVVAYTGPRLFNSSKFYKYAGFDTKEYIYEIKELNKYLDESWKKGPNVSDEHIVDEIIKEFNNKEKNKKEFYMVLTMQAHGPYKKDKYDSYDIKIKNSRFNEGMNDSILSYAQGIYDTDKQLGRLYEYIKTLDEPTIIVFYGDHLPHFTDNKGKSLIDEFKYFNTKDNLTNIYHQYNTQSLILANFEINENSYKYISPDLLSTYVLNNMDIKISNYYKWMYSNIKTFPTLNKYVTIDQNGKLYDVKNLPKKQQKYYDLRNQMQYKYFIKNK